MLGCRLLDGLFTLRVFKINQQVVGARERILGMGAVS